jgi:hypothetical protein
MPNTAEEGMIIAHYYWDGHDWVVNETWLKATPDGDNSWCIGVPLLTSGREYSIDAIAVDGANNVGCAEQVNFCYDR